MHRSQGHGAPCVLHVPKRGRLYDAAIRSSEFYWNRPTDVPCQPGDRINAVITGEEIIGKTKYTTLNACALTPNPLLTCETGDTLPARCWGRPQAAT